MLQKGTINLIEHPNAVIAKMKNRRVRIVKDEDNFLFEFVIKDGFNEPRAECEHKKGADFTRLKLTEEGAHALYFALMKMFEIKYKERN